MDPDDYDDDVYFDDDVYLDDGDNDVDYGDASNLDDDVIAPTPQKNNTYTVLKESDIIQRIDERTATVSSVLSLSKSAASILLRHHRWNPDNVHDAWFFDESLTRKSVGLSLHNFSGKRRNRNNTSKVSACGICFDEIPCMAKPVDVPLCGHAFCNACWSTYISTSIQGGPGCLFLRCPEPSCGEAVSMDMIKRLALSEDFDKYSGYIVRSYVEGDVRTKWCPGPGCEWAVEFDCGATGSCNYAVSCRCSYEFCWNCTEESHRPLDCATVSKWIAKNEVESEKVTWILAFTKPCPKCKRLIEKNTGCNHMTCYAPCYFQFCWLCLSDYKHHSCNCYKNKDEEEIKWEMDEKSIRRYLHYFERWATNSSSEQKALKDLREMEGVKIETLSRKQFLPVTHLRFITEAWAQIVECRQILKWTYVFGYYLPEKELTKKQFFEYLQGEAEVGLERLHDCAERDLKKYIDAKRPLKTFNDFRIKLTDLTKVTRNYFENLVKALENGLSDVQIATEWIELERSGQGNKSSQPSCM